MFTGQQGLLDNSVVPTVVRPAVHPNREFAALTVDGFRNIPVRKEVTTNLPAAFGRAIERWQGASTTSRRGGNTPASSILSMRIGSASIVRFRSARSGVVREVRRTRSTCLRQKQIGRSHVVSYGGRRNSVFLHPDVLDEENLP